MNNTGTFFHSNRVCVNETREQKATRRLLYLVPKSHGGRKALAGCRIMNDPRWPLTLKYAVYFFLQLKIHYQNR